MIYTIICAGGVGTRMGGSVPKQFLTVDGEPILIKTVSKFIDVTDFVYIGMAGEWLSYAENLLREYGITEKVKVVAGGYDRMATILNVVAELEKDFPVNEEDVIITHDAVRPYVTSRIISENISGCKEYGACGTFVNAVDTMAVSQNGEKLESVPERKNMYNVQTPQTVRFGILKSILNKNKNNFALFTDLCGLLLKEGKDVYMVKGDYANIKITNPADICRNITGE